MTASRPSQLQLQALEAMALHELRYTVAGFQSPGLLGRYWPSRTVMALESRGFCKIISVPRARRRARITAAGRAALKASP